MQHETPTNGAQQDLEEMKFLRHLAAARLSVASSQYYVGRAYKKGIGTPVNMLAAANWFHKAALRGHREAQFNLGILYDKGLGVKKDHEQAALWTQKAASDGCPDAQYNLGIFYAKGQGVTKHNGLAHFWIQAAAAKGHPPAISAIQQSERSSRASDGRQDTAQKPVDPLRFGATKPIQKNRPRKQVPLFSQPTTKPGF